MQKKHQEHIVCVPASLFCERANGFADYTLTSEDLMLGQRAQLESNPDFRQVLPVSVFTCNGKVWAYKRTPKGGEKRLSNKVALAVGGHFDMVDVLLDNGVIDLPKSLENAIARELREEVEITSNIIKTTTLPKVIAADETEVDKLHVAMVTMHELDGEGIRSIEDALEDIGFISPEELLTNDFDLEVWARLMCEILVSQKQN